MHASKRSCVVWLGSAFLACGGATETTDSTAERVFVAVGRDGVAARSVDGARWTVHASGTTRSLVSVAAGRKLFVAVGAAGTVVTSSDAKTWTARSSGTASDLVDVTYSDNVGFVAVGGSWTTGAVALTSPDGVAWTTIPAPDTHMFRAATRVADGTLFVSATLRSDLGTPSLFRLDGTRWTKLDGPAFSDALATPAGAAVIEEFSLSRSADGRAWAETTVTQSERLTGVAYGDGRFVVVGERGSSFSSASGQDWRTAEASPGTFLSAVAYGNGLFATVGTKGAIFTTTDGVTWTRAEPSTDKDLIAVAYAPF